MSYEHIQKKNSQQSAPPTSQDILKTRPFTPRVQKSPPTEAPSVEQAKATPKFGYNAVSLKTLAPSSSNQDSTKEEGTVETDEPKLPLGTSSETPPEIPPQEGIIQRFCSECPAEEQEEKVAKKQTETIPAQAETSSISPSDSHQNPFHPKGENRETEIAQAKQLEKPSTNILLNHDLNESERSISRAKATQIQAQKKSTPATRASRVAPATTTKNNPESKVATPTETIQTKAETSNPEITANFNQNRPDRINQNNFTLPTQTRQAKIANPDTSNLSGSNLFPLNKNHQIQRLSLSNQPYQGEVKSADLTQIIGTNPLLNKKKIQRQAKSEEKPQIGQEIQNLFASQLQRQPLPSPPTPSTTSTAKINPPPPGFLASNKHKQQPIQLKEETAQTGKETIIPKEITNSPFDNPFPVIPHQPLSISTTNPNIQRDILGIPTSIEEAKSKILSPVAQLANQIPGYPLLTLTLGKDPINGASVSRNPTNLIRGILSLIPGGDNIFNNLQQSGAIDKAFNWFNSQIAQLNLTWEMIKGLFKRAWDNLGMSDILSPSGALEKIKNVFTEPIGRIKNFAVSAGTKVMEFVWEGVMGAGGAKVMGIIKNAGGAFNNILKDPIAFCGNLVGAVRGGFQKFSGNVATHLKNGLTGWIFGALAGAGLTLPAQFDLKGIVSIVLQVVGATYEKLRGKLVNKVGEQKVVRLEKTFDFLKGIVTGGLVAAWQKIAEFTGNLQEMVMGGIKEWVKNSIITAAISKLISMFNPAGAIVQAVMAIYNTVMFFIERGAQIAALGEAVFSSIGSIAAGNVAGAANYVEQTMGRTLPVVISFLARLMGLGGISEEILGLIKRVQGKVEDAIGKVVEFIVERGKSLLGRGEEEKDERGKGKEDEGASEQDHPQLADQAIAELNKIEGASKDYKTLRKEKEAQSKQIEQNYTAKLRPGIKLSVRFDDAEKDEADGDIDFEVIIAPNTTRKKGVIPAKTVQHQITLGKRDRNGQIKQQVSQTGIMEDLLLKLRSEQLGKTEITAKDILGKCNYAISNIRIQGLTKAGLAIENTFPITNDQILSIFSSGKGMVAQELVKLRVVEAAPGGQGTVKVIREAEMKPEIAEIAPELYIAPGAQIVVSQEEELKQFIETKLGPTINRDGYSAQLDKHSEQAIWQAIRTNDKQIAAMLRERDIHKITHLSVNIHSERQMCPVCAAASNYMIANLATEAPEIWAALQEKKATQIGLETSVTSTVPFKGSAPQAPEGSSSTTKVAPPTGHTRPQQEVTPERVKQLTEPLTTTIESEGERE